MTKSLCVTVAGAGIVGLWQALTLAKAGHLVHLVEASSADAPFAASASRYAGAMLSPDCEAESAPPLVRDLGREALAMWRATYPRLINKGSLVVAMPREPRDLLRFSKLTQGHTLLDRAGLAEVEPDLTERFDAALYFPDEAHMAAPDALAFLLQAVRDAGVRVSFETDAMVAARDGDVFVDCRGRAARDVLPELRGVRGERIVVRARDVHLSRPVRLLHPRVPFYAVPWPEQIYLIGTTVIETDEAGPMTVRSALELLSAAYALHPGFAEAEILELDAGVRPSLPDNVPCAMVEDGGRVIRVNGAYRHGFLLSPMLAQAVAGYLAGEADGALLVRV